MIKATVTGNVWATRRIEGIPAGAFLEVDVDGKNVFSKKALGRFPEEGEVLRLIRA